MINRGNFLKKIHAIVQQTVSISSTKHTLGLTEEQKLIIEREIDNITESCRIMDSLVPRSK